MGFVSYERLIGRRKLRTVLKCCLVLFISSVLLIFINANFLQKILEANDDDDLKLVSRSEKLLLIVLLLTSPNNIVQRSAVRSTWSIDAEENTKVLFAIGTRDLDRAELEDLRSENGRHGDLLLLPQVRDSYKGLTAKLIESFIWIDKNLEFSFLFKGDDDTFVRLPLLVAELGRKPTERLYWGFFDGRARVKRAGQWAEPNWILCDRYLPHARGGGYVLSADLVRYVAENSAILQKFNSEDISVGTWLSPLRIRRIHDPQFDTEYVSRGCNNEYIVTHKQDPEMMRTKRRHLDEDGKLCEKEFQSRLSYVYDWEAMPSLCCIRNNSLIP